MKKMLFLGFALTPLALFASGDVQTDILPRTVNFLIFGAIIYYLLADNLKEFFTGRTKSIQSELDEVQITLDESEKKVQDAKAELEKAKQIAQELVTDAQSDIETIKNKISSTCDQDVVYLEKSFNEKIELEAKKANKEVVNEVLEELFNDKSIIMTQENLSKVILKKVA
ncbi:MAG: F0F1 ATP synthase subunit B [Arcobacteraceae bacterium]|nr:F0F1 ATP synthase subunit B [Arcobacteraceae bacterium]